MLTISPPGKYLHPAQVDAFPFSTWHRFLISSASPDAILVFAMYRFRFATVHAIPTAPQQYGQPMHASLPFITISDAGAPWLFHISTSAATSFALFIPILLSRGESDHEAGERRDDH
jgi:hypothetical protein